jgi:hypothetical protein
MVVARMKCVPCAAAVEGHFRTSALTALPFEHQRFIEMFVLAGGSLKEIAERADVSYPTVRSRLDKVMALLREEIVKSGARGSGADALAPDEAARMIKGI